MISPEELMTLAIDICRHGIQAGQTPFGCAIAVEGRVVAQAHNVVHATTDITGHAEITALRQACREVGALHLPGAVVATTCEPCPMCAAALHWARVETVYYGATIADAAAAGFNELHLSAAELLERGKSEVRLQAGTARSACQELFAHWKRHAKSRPY